MKGHETFWLKKNETVHKDAGNSIIMDNVTRNLFYAQIEIVEYEYFYCKVQKKIVKLDSWDFDYCPFCGQKLKEGD